MFRVAHAGIVCLTDISISVAILYPYLVYYLVENKSVSETDPE